MFGRRLVQYLADVPSLTLIVAGRSLPKSKAVVEDLQQSGGAMLIAQALDRDDDLARVLSSLRPDIVVDASGPFQRYHDAAGAAAEKYHVARAAISAGINYVDLADGSRFVDGIKVLDTAARAAGVTVVSGLSTFPVLTNGVLNAIAVQGVTAHAVRVGIAPSPFAGVGRNVIAAIGSYAGERIRVWLDGRMQDRTGLGVHWRTAIGIPGQSSLPRVRFSLVDVPEYRVLQNCHPELRSIKVGAGLRPPLVHGITVALAWLRAHRLFPPLDVIATPMSLASRYVRWGVDRGGLVVDVDGVDPEGQPCHARWSLLADGAAGPRIPVMVAATFILHRARGADASPGAFAGHEIAGLADYEPWFAREGIQTHLQITATSQAGMVEEQSRPLYRRVLEDAFDRLPAAVRDLHEVTVRRRFSGRASVTGARGLIAWVVARIVGFPRDMEDIPVAVTLEREGEKEIWRRDFNGQKFHSIQYVGAGRYEGMLVEQFGPMRFGLAVLSDATTLRLDVMRWDFLGLPLPSMLAPRCDAFEQEVDGVFRFSVQISLPIFGMLVHYRGHLRPEADASSVTESD